MARVHHSAIVKRDVEARLGFWRDGLGFEVYATRARPLRMKEYERT